MVYSQTKNPNLRIDLGKALCQTVISYSEIHMSKVGNLQLRSVSLCVIFSPTLVCRLLGMLGRHLFVMCFNIVGSY
jgi:hypothetical protein